MSGRSLFAYTNSSQIGSVCVSADRDWMQIFYLAYQIQTFNCSGLSTILKIEAEEN